jgi:hypothetical protein
MIKPNIARTLGYRLSADIKRAAVRRFPAPLVHFMSGRIFNFVPEDFARTGVGFVHVPKAAGTSISRALYGRSIGHDPAWLYSRAEPQLWKSIFTFSVVRDPVDRAISAFHFLRTGGTAIVPVERPDDYRALAFQSFETFTEEWLLPRADKLLRYDYSLWPQNYFLTDREDRLLVNHVSKLDELDSLESLLTAKGFVDSPIARINASDRTSASVEPSARVRAIIEKVYREDYELFGFCRQTAS